MADLTLKQMENDSLQFSQALMSIFQTQFGTQQGMLNFLNGKMQAMIKNPTGFSSQDLTALRTAASSNVATQFNNAQTAAQTTMAARSGGATSPVMSGVDKQIQGQIKAGEAGALSGDLNQIEMANEQQKQNNYWNAVKEESGVAEMENPQSFGSLADSTENSGTEAGKAFFDTQGPGIGAIVGGALGGAASSFLGGQGFAKLMGK